MWSYVWPILLILVGNCFYNICAKSTPISANAYLCMTVTYGIGAGVSYLLFLFSKNTSSFLEELQKLNWTAIVLGLSIVALEIGYIFAYRVGWKINVASLVTNILLAIVLIFIGYYVYGETLSVIKAIGIFFCCLGLFLIIK